MWSDDLLEINRGLSSPIKDVDSPEDETEEPRGIYFIETDTLRIEMNDKQYQSVTDDTGDEFNLDFELFSTIHHEVGHSALTKGTLAWHETFIRNAVTTLDFINLSSTLINGHVDKLDPDSDLVSGPDISETFRNLSKNLINGGCQVFLDGHLNTHAWTPIQESYAIIQESVIVDDVGTINYLDTYINEVIPVNLIRSSPGGHDQISAVLDQETPISPEKVESVSWLYQAEILSAAIQIFQNSSGSDRDILDCIHRLASISSDYQTQQAEWRERAPKQFLHMMKLWAEGSEYLFTSSDRSAASPEATADHLTMAAGYEVPEEDVRTDYRSERFDDLMNQAALSSTSNARTFEAHAKQLTKEVSSSTLPSCIILSNRETDDMEATTHSQIDMGWLLLQHILSTKVKWIFFQSVLVEENLFKRSEYTIELDRMKKALSDHDAIDDDLDEYIDDPKLYFQVLDINGLIGEIKSEIISGYEERTGWSFDTDTEFLHAIGLASSDA